MLLWQIVVSFIVPVFAYKSLCCLQGRRIVNMSNSAQQLFGSSSDRLMYSPAFERNRDPILAVLQEKVINNFEGRITVLEVGSGTGQHAIYFTSQISSVSSGFNNKYTVWLPSEPSNIDPIQDWIQATKDHSLIGNMCHPVLLDVCSNEWSCVEDIDSFTTLRTLSGKAVPAVSCIVTINMIHIAPWAATLGLINGAKRILTSGGILYLYGPFKRNNLHTAPSNDSFDSSLRQRNPEWGVRNLETILDIASSEFKLRQIIEMPANNLSVILEKL
jgi:SAM-dependent methyltransferase